MWREVGKKRDRKKLKLRNCRRKRGRELSRERSPDGPAPSAPPYPPRDFFLGHTGGLRGKPCFSSKDRSDRKEKCLGNHSNNEYGKAWSLLISLQWSPPGP